MEPLPSVATTSSDHDLRHYTSMLWRRKWLIVGVAVIFAVVALALALRQPEQYRATGELLVTAQTAPDSGGAQLSSGADRAVGNEVEIIGSAAVRQEVDAVIGTAVRVDAQGKGETDIIILSATSTDPQLAADSVNAYAEAYETVRQQRVRGGLEEQLSTLEEQRDLLETQIRELQAPLQALDDQIFVTPPGPERDALVGQRTQIDQSISANRDELFVQLTGVTDEMATISAEIDNPIGGVEVLNEARVPSEPFAPSPKKDGLTAGAAGLLVGLGLAFAWENLDDRIRDRRGAERAAGTAPILGEVPFVAPWKKAQADLALASDPHSPPAEAYRSLLTSIDFLRLGQHPVIQITSAMPGEGKTTTAANLAVAFAEGGRRVILVEADLRRPRLHELFPKSTDAGLSTVLAGLEDVAQATQTTIVDNLDLLAAGPVPPNPSELLRSDRLGDTLAKLSESYDVVLIDTPPINPVTDGLLVSAHARGTIVVAAAGLTRRDSLERAFESLRQARAQTVVLILNAVDRSSAEHQYGYGGQSDSRRDRWSRDRAAQVATAESGGHESDGRDGA